VITYQSLDEQALKTILDQQLTGLQDHVNTRLADKGFTIEVSEEGRAFLLDRGTSAEYGARELKRTIYRYLTQPLSTLVIEGKIEAGSCVDVEVDGEKLRFSPRFKGSKEGSNGRTLLIVDDNSDFLRLLYLHLERTIQWQLITAQSAAEAERVIAEKQIDCALLDLVLPDGNGMKIARQLKLRQPKTQVIIMTGGSLTLEEDQTCRAEGFQVIKKPFLTAEVIGMIEVRRRAAPA
jgi:CheY-like chemotaxis protein